ncbi:hypothetical protein [Paraburkholderia sp. BR10954]|uniref:hypothetical protein n=1 Tax=Paraburkholderia sp. BR10954 TaxID=3236995 RepID=UPI0034D22E85
MANDDNYRQGSIEIIKGRPQYHAMSNAFEIANRVAQYGRIVVGKNLRCGIDAEISAHWIRVTPPGAPIAETRPHQNSTSTSPPPHDFRAASR